MKDYYVEWFYNGKNREYNTRAMTVAEVIKDFWNVADKEGRELDVVYEMVYLPEGECEMTLVFDANTCPI
jgi:hypothetical protein